ncbi:MAG: YeeE/YedE thiosulfate transporter family protein [Candidatus Bathyarchaeota archaeon]
MFPLGIEPYLVGGVLVGLGVGLIYLVTGLHATQSSLLTTTLSWFSKRIGFQQEKNVKERSWRVTLALGLVIGALLHTLTLSPTGFWSTSVQLWRLSLGGLLVGFGTRLSGGCTSGHGISGVASLSRTSIVAVIVFMGVAIVMAHLVQLLGVLP